MADRIHYRKLPGRYRGFLHGSSVWLGPDHLLLVKSMRFREEYKRYQFRDIQGIAIARHRCFHISTRAFGIAVLWLIAVFASITLRNSTVSGLLGLLACILVVIWLYVSAKSSCVCRIYTAVSRDELPSVYRTWVANRFLRALEPQIAAVQGVLEGAWTDAIGNQDVGPREALPHESAQPESDREPGSSAASIHSASYYFLLATLFVSGLWHARAIYYPLRWGPVASDLLALLVLVAAILVLVQYHRRRLRRAQQRLAIAALVAIGLVYYVRLTVVGAITGARAAIEKNSVVLDYNSGPLTGKIETGIMLLLGLAGLVILFAGRATNEPKSIPS